MPPVIVRLLVLGCVVGLTACANINSISRSTSLPWPEEGKQGKAVHLDAQQRVLIVNGLGSYCSEPSPDALAAFAASLGLGASVPGTGGGSLAGGQQSSAASIGLRTQSITLMRDALFRMCEAYANGAIGPNQIATLLGRSQDLTAVILAVEQLTGAVAANQVTLTGTTSASASASLLSNQGLLDAAREDETRKQAELEEANANLAGAKKTRDDRGRKEAAAKAKRDQVNANPDATDREKASAQSAWESSQQDLQRAQRDVDAAENMVKTRETLLKDSTRNRETIESSKDSALTAAAAGTTGSGQFSTPVARNVLSKEATVAIAGAVQNMVQAVLRKEYTEDACMAMITYIPRDYDKWDAARRAALEKVQDRCADFVFQSISMRIETATFGVDDSSDRLQAWMKSDEGNRTKLQSWLDGKNLGLRVTLLVFGAEHAGLRRLAINELRIP